MEVIKVKASALNDQQLELVLDVLNCIAKAEEARAIYNFLLAAHCGIYGLAVFLVYRGVQAYKILLYVFFAQLVILLYQRLTSDRGVSKSVASFRAASPDHEERQDDEENPPQ